MYRVLESGISLIWPLYSDPRISSFKTKLTQIIRPMKRSVYKISDLNGSKLLTRLRVKFSDLREHKFRHNFFSTSTCMCNRDVETTEHYLLRCHLYSGPRVILLDSVSNIINEDVTTFSEQSLCLLLLYGNENMNEIANRLILESTIIFINDSGRFTRYVN